MAVGVGTNFLMGKDGDSRPIYKHCPLTYDTTNCIAFFPLSSLLRCRLINLKSEF